MTGESQAGPALPAAYFDRVRARDLAGVVALFAKDARLGLPDGRELAGAEAITAMYTGVFAGASPDPRIGTIIREGALCAVEFEAHFADGAMRPTVNIFRIDGSGLIAELRIYSRSA